MPLLFPEIRLHFENFSFDDNSDDGYYTIGITDFASNLPIELTYFDAYFSNESVIVNWQTASETNNDYFIVERSFRRN
jgi:glycine cleavage system H lipoate-binding protein